MADAALQPLTARIAALADPALHARGHSAVHLGITTTDGRCLRDGLDTAPGFAGAALTAALQDLGALADARLLVDLPVALQMALPVALQVAMLVAWQRPAPEAGDPG